MGERGMDYDPGEYCRALHDGPFWRVYMENAAKRLEDDLYETTGVIGIMCEVCGKNMSRGARDHILSSSHWCNLWTRLSAGKTIPGHGKVCDWSAKWVQRFELGQGGTLLFNHITGGQMILGE